MFAVGFVASIIIRIPHDKQSQKTKITESRRGIIEKLLLSLMLVGVVILPVLSLTPLLSFAAYKLEPTMFVLGIVTTMASLWLFHRSHADLGKNWSVSLEIREGHSLVTGGVYESIRHPMYTSIFLLAIGQAFLLPNWIAGPAALIAFTIMFLLSLVMVLLGSDGSRRQCGPSKLFIKVSLPPG